MRISTVVYFEGKEKMKTNFVALVMAILISSMVYGYGYSDYDWKTYNGHQYAITLDYSNWTQAEAWAVEVGGHLVTINDGQENAWVAELIKDSYTQGHPNDPIHNLAWIGLKYVGGDRNSPSSWRWVSGEPVTYWNRDHRGIGGWTGTHMHLAGERHPEAAGEWSCNAEHDTNPSYYPRGIIELSEPREPWSFVQISDTHIGASWVDCLPMPLPEGGYGVACGRWSARNNLAVVLHKVSNEVKPSFIVNTGDVADYGCLCSAACPLGSIACALLPCPGNYKNYLEAIEPAQQVNIQVYSVPGNHDGRTPWPHLCPCHWGLGCYYNSIKFPSGVSELPFSDREDFYFEKNGMLFIGLDSGWGNCSGSLSSDQIKALRNLPTGKPKIILTHHPAVADNSEIPWYEHLAGLGCNEVNIVQGSGEFLTYCEDNNNVLAVLSGHTHRNHEYDKDLGVPTDYPYYIQTGTAGKVTMGEGEYPVFRKIDVIGGEVKINDVTRLTKEDYNYLWYQNYSPTNLHVYDSNWRHTGYDPNEPTGFERGIPDSVYFSHYVVEDENGIKVFPEEVMIFDPCENYLSRIIGTETGPYRLVISSVADGNQVVFEANDIPSLPGAVHDYRVDWNDVNGVLVTIDIDEDGNGVPEMTIVSDNKLTGDEFVSEWPLLNEYVSIRVDHAGYDHQKKRLGVDITVTNTSGEILGVPLWVVIEGVSEPNVALADANGVTSQDKNYADFSDLLLDDRQLSPGESITKRIYFNNPDGVRFTFEPGLRGVILEEPGMSPMAGVSSLLTHWLEGEASLDVAPAGGDGIVNFRDFALIAEDWLNKEE